MALAPIDESGELRHLGGPEGAERRALEGIEDAILGALIVDPDAAWPEVRDVLRERPDLVSATPGRHELAGLLVEMLEAGRPVDSVLLRAEIARRDLRYVHPEFPTELARGIGTTGRVRAWMDELIRVRTGAKARSAGASLDALSLARVLSREEARLERGVERIATGWPRLDAALGGGLEVPSLNVLGAAPKSGKSMWAQIVAARHAEAGGVVYYLDLENGRRRFLRRLLCRHAQLGAGVVASALRDHRSGVFTSRAAVERWGAAKAWVRDMLADRLFVEFTAPRDLGARLAAVRHAAGDRRVLVVIDSLQKLPSNLQERRAGIDAWMRSLEALRHELDLAILLVSEIRRGREGYVPSEDAFKESSGIEYGGDLLMTMDRPPAGDDESERVSTLRVQLAREADEDAAGDVASYAPVRPFYGLEELDPAPRVTQSRRGAPAGKQGPARAFLEQQLASGPVPVGDLVRRGEAAGFSRATVYRARNEPPRLPECTLSLKAAWRLP